MSRGRADFLSGGGLIMEVRGIMTDICSHDILMAAVALQCARLGHPSARTVLKAHLIAISRFDRSKI
jgi:hypothetical protein